MLGHLLNNLNEHKDEANNEYVRSSNTNEYIVSQNTMNEII